MTTSKSLMVFGQRIIQSVVFASRHTFQLHQHQTRCALSLDLESTQEREEDFILDILQVHLHI